MSIRQGSNVIAGNPATLPTNLVTTDTAQAISGLKTLTNQLYKKSTTIDIDTPDGVKADAIYFFDKNDVLYSFLQAAQFANGQVQFGIGCKAASGNAFTEMALFQMPDGSVFTYAPPSASANSIVTTLGITKAAKGYVKLGNGIIIQWGTTTSASSSTSITLPIAFSDTNYSVTITSIGDAGVYQRLVSASTAKTTTGFKTYAGGGAANINFSWQAIGY